MFKPTSFVNHKRSQNQFRQLLTDVDGNYFQEVKCDILEPSSGIERARARARERERERERDVGKGIRGDRGWL